jgi:hypothetical protein
MKQHAAQELRYILGAINADIPRNVGVSLIDYLGTIKMYVRPARPADTDKRRID